MSLNWQGTITNYQTAVRVQVLKGSFIVTITFTEFHCPFSWAANVQIEKGIKTTSENGRVVFVEALSHFSNAILLHIQKAFHFTHPTHWLGHLLQHLEKNYFIPHAMHFYGLCPLTDGCSRTLRDDEWFRWNIWYFKVHVDSCWSLMDGCWSLVHAHAPSKIFQKDDADGIKILFLSSGHSRTM